MACIVCNKDFIAPSHKERTCSEDCRIENKRNIKNEWYHRNKHKGKAYYEENKGRIRTQSQDYRAQNRDEILARGKKYREENKEVIKERSKDYTARSVDKRKDYHLKKHFNMSLNDYNLMLQSQNQSCLICLRHESEFKKKLAVDHCHQTGKVRGILCHGCNKSLGSLQDSIENLQRAINYLNKSREE